MQESHWSHALRSCWTYGEIMRNENTLHGMVVQGVQDQAFVLWVRLNVYLKYDDKYVLELTVNRLRYLPDKGGIWRLRTL